MEGLGIYEADLCSGCRLPTVVRSNPANLFTIDHDVCPVCAQIAPAGRVQADADQKFVEALGEKPPPAKPRPADGRTAMLRRLPASLGEQPADHGHDADDHEHPDQQ